MKVKVPFQYESLFLAICLIYFITFVDLVSGLVELNFPVFRYFIYLISFVLFVRGIIQTKTNRRTVNPVSRLIFNFFFVWTICMFLLSIKDIIDPANNYINFKIIISGTLLLYTLPFILFSEPSEYFIAKVFKLAYLLAIFFLIVAIPLLPYFLSPDNYQESYGIVFGGGASILVLTSVYQSKAVKWVSFITILLILFITAVNARRNQVVYFGLILLFAGLIPLVSQSVFMRKRKKIAIANFIGFSFFLLFFIIFNSSRFSYLIERSKTGMESRQDYIDEFYDDFNAHPTDWVTGRGVIGDFTSHIWEVSRESERRPGIESGYLDFILRGGYIYVLLLVSISLPAIFLGFFLSKNILSKAFAALILINLIDLIGFGIPGLTLKYLFIWIGIGVCYSRRMRNYDDKYLSTILKI